MARLTPERSAELAAFWRSDHEGWANSSLNRRAYREAHGPPLKRFGNWRAEFKDEAEAAQKGLLYRWKQEPAVPQAQPKTEPVVLPVTVSDSAATAEATPTGPEPSAPPLSAYPRDRYPGHE